MSSTLRHRLFTSLNSVPTGLIGKGIFWQVGVLTIVCCLLGGLRLNAQPVHEYFFANTLTGNGGGPVLTQSLACGATAGSFSVQSISTNAGFCAIDDAFCFTDGGGLAYANPSYITNSYSINVFFKFNTIGGWSRIIDFSNSTSDAGIYLLNDCLNFYPNGNVGTCPYFVANLWYLFTLVRSGATGVISCYVNGTLFGSYNDSGTNLYRPATSTTPIIFFRDDNVVTCETQPGCVNYLNITSAEMTPLQVNNLWLTICAVILNPSTPELTAHCATGGGVELNWVADEIAEGDLCTVERSANGVDWEEIGAFRASMSKTAFMDRMATGPAQYRLRIEGVDQTPLYSRTVSVEACPVAGVSLFPNPATRDVTLLLPKASPVVVTDLLGNKVMTTQMDAGRHMLDIGGIAAGTYLVHSCGEVVRLVVQP